MLKETEKFLKQINETKQNQKPKKNIFGWLNKYKTKIIIILLITLLLLFPTFIATIIGTWIVDFVGTLLKIISTGL